LNANLPLAKKSAETATAVIEAGIALGFILRSHRSRAHGKRGNAGEISKSSKACRNTHQINLSLKEIKCGERWYPHQRESEIIGKHSDSNEIIKAKEMGEKMKL